MNQFTHPAVLADSVIQTNMYTYHMVKANKLLKDWLAMTESEDYRQTYKSFQDEYVTLSLLDARLYALLQVNGLSDEIRKYATQYMDMTERLIEDLLDLVHERWPDPDEISEDAPHVH